MAASCAGSLELREGGSAGGGLLQLGPAVTSEQLCEYVHVIVADGEGAGGPSEGSVNGSVHVAGLPEELAQSLAHTSAVFYVQPDGSLVQAGGQSDQPSPLLHLGPEELQQVIEQLRWAEQEEAAAPHPAPGDTSVTAGHGSSNTGASLLSSPVTVMENAAQQLQSVAQHVALQQSHGNPVTRLINHKQLESIRIQVPCLQTKENGLKIPPETAVHRKTHPQNPSVLDIPIIRIQPLSGSGQQQFFPHSSSSESPIQLFVQQPRSPSLKPQTVRSTNKVSTTKTLNGQRICTSSLRTLPVNDNPISSALEKCPREDQKLKKSLKVKTRSGRISRPPKHKAKDYKFIKTEDLADGRPSDSDDYSELSIEDDDDRERKGILFDSQTCTLKPKMFQCESCEKSYIGKGGLSRHYKFYPAHEQLEPLDRRLISVTRTNGDMFWEVSGVKGNAHINSDVCTPPIVDTEKNKTACLPHAEEVTPQQMAVTVESLCDPQHPNENSLSSLARAVFKGRGRPKGPKRRGRPRVSGRTKCAERRGTPGRPPKTSCGISTEQDVRTRKARLKELLQQCDNDDLKELVLPCLTRLVTVYEFLLLKVEQDHPDKPLFPQAYKEFEQLHTMVKILAHDYFSNVVLSIEQSLEIKHSKVAESLDITEELIAKQTPPVADSAGCLASSNDRQVNSGLKQKHADQVNCPDDELLPPVKRLRTEVTDDMCTDGNGIQANAEDLCEAEYEGLRCQREDAADNGIVAIISKAAQDEGTANLDLKTESSGSGVFPQTRTGSSEALQSHASMTTPPCSSESSRRPEELFIVNTLADGFDEGDFVHKNTAKAVDLEFSSCLLFAGETKMYAYDQVNSEPYKQENAFDDHGHSDQLYNTDFASQMQELEKAFSINVPMDDIVRTCDDPRMPPVQNVPLSPQGASLDGKSDETATVYEVSSESHGLFTQGNEHVFIQTTEGLVLSRSASTGTPQSIVILTHADATASHIHTPSGGTLETVEALLEME
ncbi:hypothetical protein FKM82_016921 [Ascaphus truei]